MANDTKSPGNHEAVRHWIEARIVKPGTGKGIGSREKASILPTPASEQALHRATWEIFLEKFTQA